MLQEVDTPAPLDGAGAAWGRSRNIMSHALRCRHALPAGVRGAPAPARRASRACGQAPQWYCPSVPSALSTLWQGMSQASGFAPTAWPTARAAPAFPAARASACVSRRPSRRQAARARPSAGSCVPRTTRRSGRPCAARAPDLAAAQPRAAVVAHQRARGHVRQSRLSALALRIRARRSTGALGPAACAPGQLCQTGVVCVAAAEDDAGAAVPCSSPGRHRLQR